MKVILKYKDLKGNINEVIENLTHAKYLAHSNVVFNKIWLGAEVLSMKDRGPYYYIGEDIQDEVNIQ